MEDFGNAWMRSRRIRRLRAQAARGESVSSPLAAELLARAAQMLQRERPSEALDAVEEAVSLGRSGPPEPRATRLLLTEALTMRGLVLSELRRFGEAEVVASEALALAEELRAEEASERVLSMVRTAHHLLAACAAHDGRPPAGPARA